VFSFKKAVYIGSDGKIDISKEFKPDKKSDQNILHMSEIQSVFI
jgi:hypothetical protein